MLLGVVDLEKKFVIAQNVENMLITRTSQYSQIERTLDIPCTQEQYDAYKNGQHIQLAMPNVSESDREFILSGMTQNEWDECFPEEEGLDYPLNENNLPYSDAF
jgi:hypothetical protein